MKKILAADDDLETLELYRALFEDAGYDFKAVSDVTGAVMLCLSFKPDLLVLDWDMPAGGGGMIFEKMRELLGKEIPVLFITCMPKQVNKAGQPRVEVMEKPVSNKMLLNAVARLLKD